jgi:hypothetical protein
MDEITENEIDVLIGRVEKDGISRSLFPSEEIIRTAYPPGRIGWDQRCNLIIIRRWDEVSRNDGAGATLLTPAQWQKWFHRDLTGLNKSKHILTDEDWLYGKTLVTKYFPESWDGKRLEDIKIPERFIPTS